MKRWRRTQRQYQYGNYYYGNNYWKGGYGNGNGKESAGYAREGDGSGALGGNAKAPADPVADQLRARQGTLNRVIKEMQKGYDGGDLESLGDLNAAKERLKVVNEQLDDLVPPEVRLRSLGDRLKAKEADLAAAQTAEADAHQAIEEAVKAHTAARTKRIEAQKVVAQIRSDLAKQKADQIADAVQVAPGVKSGPLATYIGQKLHGMGVRPKGQPQEKIVVPSEVPADFFAEIYSFVQGYKESITPKFNLEDAEQIPLNESDSEAASEDMSDDEPGACSGEASEVAAAPGGSTGVAISSQETLAEKKRNKKLRAKANKIAKKDRVRKDTPSKPGISR